LKRGAERLAFDPKKRYFYVEHPTEGWRVYLRACCFIHEQGVEFDPARFIVVKKIHSGPDTKSWEPPKGQMEGKDGLKNSSQSIISIMRQNVNREVYEESRITKVTSLEYTGHAFQAREDDYPPNTYFQYHIFHAFASPAVIEAAFDEFDWIKEHPKALLRMRRDFREKDEIAWFNPRKTRLMGRWSPSIVSIYLKAMKY
jgi:hypothetical protein